MVIPHPPSATMNSKRYDFTRNPMLVYWEMTQACMLACRHCRAEAMPSPHPLELTPIESMGLLCQIAAFGDPLPHLILTGGDPLSRKDLFRVIDDARALGLQVSITPSATPALTAEALNRLQSHGIQSLGLSLDGSSATRHDAVRAVSGCFERTIDVAREAGRLGLPIQINTLVAKETAADLPAIYELLKTFPVMRWSLFFLISVGRGKALQEVSPARGEEIMNWILDLLPDAPFAVKTTEAPSYRRLALNHMHASGRTAFRNQKQFGLQRFPDSRRPRDRLCFQPGRHLSFGLLTPALRQCANRFVGGGVPAGTAFSGAALAGSVQGKVWRV